jgi:hypothetical protein
MKTIILFLVLALGTTPSFAACMSRDNKPAEAFKRNFETATDVKWEEVNGYMKVSFTVSAQAMQAYYTPAGELVSVIRNITSDQLPLMLLLELKNIYKNYWVTELFEVVSGDQHGYFMTLENSNREIVLQSNSDKTWGVFAKRVKS